MQEAENRALNMALVKKRKIGKWKLNIEKLIQTHVNSSVFQVLWCKTCCITRSSSVNGLKLCPRCKASAAQQPLIIHPRLVGAIIIPHYILKACSAPRHRDTRVHETFSGASSFTPSFFSCRLKYPTHESFRVEIISGDYEGDSSGWVLCFGFFHVVFFFFFSFRLCLVNGLMVIVWIRRRVWKQNGGCLRLTSSDNWRS